MGQWILNSGYQVMNGSDHKETLRNKGLSYPNLFIIWESFQVAESQGKQGHGSNGVTTCSNLPKFLNFSSVVKNRPAMQECSLFLGQKDLLEKRKG